MPPAPPHPLQTKKETTMTTNKKIVTRIRRLMALAESSNENEAASAAKLARKLMVEHAVSLAALSESALLEEDPVEIKGIDVGKSTWAINLAWALGAHCNVSVIRSVRWADRNCYDDPPDSPNRTPYDWDTHRRRTFAVAYGHRSDLEVWEYLYTVAKREIQRLTRLERQRIKERDGWVTRTEATQYREGLVGGLRVKLRQMKAQAAQQEENTGTALALQSRAARARAEMENANPSLGSYKGGVGGSFSGYRDGQKIDLNPGLQAKPGAKLLGGE